jgi:CRP-like cAMP-binding protein
MQHHDLGTWTAFDQLIKIVRNFVMAAWHEILLKKLDEHSRLSGPDIEGVRTLPNTQKLVWPQDDIVRQGDKPNASIVVMQGMLARYHTLRGGGRQYLSLHIAGDMPDAQTLFLESMDHSVCALSESVVAIVPHRAIISLFEKRPAVGMAIWRETLVDAAIFRAAITNNSARPLLMRLAHFFCEQYYRARVGGMTTSGSCSLPLTQTQIGETLGASLPSVSRALQRLRKTRSMDLRGGQLHIRNWDRLVELGDFDPSYLHLRRAVEF